VSLIRRVEGFLFGAETGRRLSAVHLALAALLGLRIALGPYRGLAHQPRSLYRPVWFLRPLPAMPPLAVIVALQVVGTAAAVLVADRRHRRLGFFVAWACLLVLAGLRSSRGKILHNDVLLLLVCVPFLVAAAVTAATRDRPSTRYGWPIRTALVVVAGAYFFSGLHKLHLSGPAWVTTDNLRFIMEAASASDRVTFPAIPAFVAHQGWLTHVLAAAVITLELSFPVVAFLPGWRPAYALAAVGFHAGTWLTMGLDYWLWAAVTVVILVDWTGTSGVSPLRRRRADRWPRPGPWPGSRPAR